jgi:hypothetical protein
VKIDLNGVIQWINALEQIKAKGQPVVDAIRSALAAHGIDADNALLDAVIADDARREQLARQDAGDVSGAVVTGGSGE